MQTAAVAYASLPSGLCYAFYSVEEVMAVELSETNGAVVSVDMSTLEQAVGHRGIDSASSQMPRMLGTAGFVTATMAVAAAAFTRPPSDTFLARGHGIGFYAGLGGAFAAGVAEMWMAIQPAQPLRKEAPMCRRRPARDRRQSRRLHLQAQVLS
ncbi:hypothetical protein GUJ93_ZPchr0008g12897 [Zizania palustris]|uniref:Uncharacterized protein n=1 Tax=Zizania palustris TaxID=103762 RepID=A0A8J5V406_ZIZPA|nr:hypothetical protein GUJ93_ZPchr0008g12897 [Zizania palustris]